MCPQNTSENYWDKFQLMCLTIHWVMFEYGNGRPFAEVWALAVSGTVNFRWKLSNKEKIQNALRWQLSPRVTEKKPTSFFVQPCPDLKIIMSVNSREKKKAKRFVSTRWIEDSRLTKLCFQSSNLESYFNTKKQLCKHVQQWQRPITPSKFIFPSVIHVQSLLLTALALGTTKPNTLFLFGLDASRFDCGAQRHCST